MMAKPRYLKPCRHLLAFVVAAPLFAAAVRSAEPTNSPFARWEPEIRAFEAADRTNPPARHPILFVGSSTIRLWKTLDQDFAGLPVVNRGFGGSQMADAWHFADRIVIPRQPRQIVLYAGGNDINAGKTAEQVFRDFIAFVGKVHEALPETRIAYISIAPTPARWARVDQVKRANRLIEAFTKTDTRLDFIDVFPHMLGADGLPKPDIFVADRLHLNAKGYEIWKSVVGPHLRQ